MPSLPTARPSCWVLGCQKGSEWRSKCSGRRQLPEFSHLGSSLYLVGRVKTEFLVPGSATSLPSLLLQVFCVCLLTCKGCREGSCPLSEAHESACHDLIDSMQLTHFATLFPVILNAQKSRKGP